MLPYGYIFKVGDKKVYDPDRKIDEPLSDLDIINHNTKLATMEIETAMKTGKALLYLYRDRTQSYSVGTWDGTYKFPCLKGKTSWHNFAGKDGRIDCWFKIKDQSWHGVNIGNNDIVHAKRIKSRKVKKNENKKYKN